MFFSGPPFDDASQAFAACPTLRAPLAALVIAPVMAPVSFSNSLTFL
jgi:hypothetical protein